MSEFHFPWQAFGINGKTMVLRCNRYFSALKILHRLVGATVAELQFERRTAESESKHLVTKTDAKDRPFADQTSHGGMGVRQRGRVAWSIGQKYSVRIKSKDFVRRGSCRNDSNPEAFLAKQPQDVALDAVIVGDNVEPNGR